MPRALHRLGDTENCKTRYHDASRELAAVKSLRVPAGQCLAAACGVSRHPLVDDTQRIAAPCNDSAPLATHAGRPLRNRLIRASLRTNRRHLAYKADALTHADRYVAPPQAVTGHKPTRWSTA